MKYIKRFSLPSDTTRGLATRQRTVNALKANGILNVTKEWKNGRKLKSVKTALRTLKIMAGETERCMYCQDSHGSDIEHFEPKASFPESLYRWGNMLLCCAECNRFKDNKFPTLSDGSALLVDPTKENPWDYIDFDPVTGNMTARFIISKNAYSPKGESTVEILHLSRRGALAALYKRANQAIIAAVNGVIQDNADKLGNAALGILGKDFAGLLGWYITGSGQSEGPFPQLKIRCPDLWEKLESQLVSVTHA